ncbi:MAG TPA: AAA family ATPase [Planctomycetota bacterium]|nr:AAA family ATPase [Planctomycetota bacterium]
MSLLSESRLDEILRSNNPWWATGALPQRGRATAPRRQDATLLGTGRPTLVAGPRRSGKTCALLRLVDAHLRADGHPRDVAYLPLDHPLLRLAPLGQLVDRALKLMEARERPRLLLDGIQALPQWPERFVDVVRTRPYPRITAASSVAPGNEEGCFEVVPLPTLSFREFCDLRGIPDLGVPPLDPLRPRLPDEVDSGDDRLFARVLDPLLADYLVRGGFPETVLEPDTAAGHQIVREGVVARAVYQDLPAVVSVMKLADLERVLLAALLQGGSPLVMEAMGDALELDLKTVHRYFEHLQRAFLLTSLKNFAAATDRSRARLHASDPAIANALCELGPAVLARAAERRSLLAGALVAHLQRLATERGLDLAYFREGDLDADAVLVSPDGAVPIVLLDQDEAGDEEAAAAERLLKRVQGGSAFLLSRGGPRRRAPLTFFETINHLPAAYFLYALG